MRITIFWIKPILKKNINKKRIAVFVFISERVIYGNKQGIYGIFNGAVIRS